MRDMFDESPHEALRSYFGAAMAALLEAIYDRGYYPSGFPAFARHAATTLDGWTLWQDLVGPVCDRIQGMLLHGPEESVTVEATYAPDN